MASLIWRKRQEPGLFLGQTRTPDGMRIYAVGDIHGRSDCLDAMIAMIDADCHSEQPVSCRIVFLGDYTDRGPDSRGVIERLVRLSARPEVVCLKGNHDEWLEMFLLRAEIGDRFLHWGGFETLASYGVDVSEGRSNAELSRDLVENMPAAHRRFFSRLRHRHVEGDYFFCHAGVRPGVALDEQDPHDLMWIRAEFHAHEASWGKVIVHGHTPREQVEICRNRINVDTAAFETGTLSCVVLEDNRWRILQTELPASL